MEISHIVVLLILIIFFPLIIGFSFVLFEWAIETDDNTKQIRKNRDWLLSCYSPNETSNIVIFQIYWAIGLFCCVLLSTLLYSIRDDMYLIIAFLLPISFVIFCLLLRGIRSILRKRIRFFEKLKS